MKGYSVQYVRRPNGIPKWSVYYGKKISWTRKKAHMVSACYATMGTWALARDLSITPDTVICLYISVAWEMRADSTLKLAGQPVQPTGWAPGQWESLSQTQSCLHGGSSREGSSLTLRPLCFSGLFSRHPLKRLLYGCLKLSEHLQALSMFWLLQTVWFAFPKYASLFLVPCALQMRSASSL